MKITATLFSAQRIKNSTNGNPRFRLSTSEGVYDTKADAEVGYDIKNHTGGGKRVVDR